MSTKNPTYKMLGVQLINFLAQEGARFPVVEIVLTDKGMLLKDSVGHEFSIAVFHTVPAGVPIADPLSTFVE